MECRLGGCLIDTDRHLTIGVLGWRVIAAAAATDDLAEKYADPGIDCSLFLRALQQGNGDIAIIDDAALGRPQVQRQGAGGECGQLLLEGLVEELCLPLLQAIGKFYHARSCRWLGRSLAGLLVLSAAPGDALDNDIIAWILAMNGYFHQRIDTTPWGLPVGKIVCVGRNYAAHAKELNNPIPTEPLLFIKPATAAVAMERPISIPRGQGECHHELEMVLLIGQPLSDAAPEEAIAAVAAVGLGLDLTLRDVQARLKAKGQPWERAKSFDGACPLSRLVDAAGMDLMALSLRLEVNGELRQSGNSRDMLFPMTDLLADISRVFTLLPGDLVMTGTPAGVGPLNSGDRLTAELGDLLSVESRVV